MILSRDPIRTVFYGVDLCLNEVSGYPDTSLKIIILSHILNNPSRMYLILKIKCFHIM
jgi:hypothetical protein